MENLYIKDHKNWNKDLNNKKRKNFGIWGKDSAGYFGNAFASLICQS